MPDVYKLGYEASDAAVPSAMIDGALALMLFDLMRYVVQREKPDVIVATHPMYLSALGAVFAVTQQPIPLVTVITDLATVHRVWFNPSADLYLAPTQAVYDLALEYGLPEQKVKITGLPVDPHLAQTSILPAALRAELDWRPDLTTVLAVGGKRVAHLSDALHVLNHSGLPLQLAVVAGGDDELYANLKAIDWHVPAYVYNFVENMPTLMQASDVLLGKAGGLIVTEALACGRPLVLIDVIPGQETGNADYVVKGGAGELAASPLEVLEIMCHWLMDGGMRLAQRAEHARRLGRPRAAYEAAELIWAAVRSPTPPAVAAHPPAPTVLDIIRSLPNPGALFAGLTAKGKKKDGPGKGES